MKKVLFILFALLLIVIAGCSSSKAGSEDTSVDSSTTTEESNFPEKPITLIVPYAPGGSTDVSARIIAKEVSKYLPNNETVVVENREGGASTVGLTSLFYAEPDGYTLSISMETGLAIKPHTDNLEYEWDSFEEIMRLVASPQLLIIREDAPWETFDEWLEYVKDNPGAFKYAHSGAGSIGHLAMEELGAKAGVELTPVPYDGGGPSMQALLAGDVEGTIGNPYQVDPELNRILIDTGSEKSDLYDAPIIKDFGIDMGNTPWIGLLAPPGTPENRMQIIHDAFKQALEDPEVSENLIKQGLPPYYADSEEFKEVIEERYNTNRQILEDIGMIN